MRSLTINIFGWSDAGPRKETVNLVSSDQIPILSLGTEDCSLLWSQDACHSGEEISYVRINEQEQGLLERCFSTTRNGAPLKSSNGKGHIVYMDSRNSIWSYDAIGESSSEKEGPATDNIDIHRVDVLNTAESSLWAKLKSFKANIFGSYRHNLIASGIAVDQIAAGDSHCLILAEGGALFSFGSGGCGELGIGSQIPHSRTLQRVVFPDNVDVKYIAAGSYYSAAIAKSGILYTFGCGAYYRLGHGSDENVTLPKKVEALEGVGMLLPDGTSTGASALQQPCSACSVTATAFSFSESFVDNFTVCRAM